MVSKVRTEALAMVHLHMAIRKSQHHHNNDVDIDKLSSKS